MAVHDAVYATPPPSWEAFRWRLQHIAEQRIGSDLRTRQAEEDAAMRKLQSAR